MRGEPSTDQRDLAAKLSQLRAGQGTGLQRFFQFIILKEEGAGQWSLDLGILLWVETLPAFVISAHQGYLVSEVILKANSVPWAPGLRLV